ncbi:SelB C-terminal domain-containing protein [Pseudonocardia sp. KRD291]|uniref:selenocysteine-specific translation elongation factor n=1 Tax=Pseudonocardia sp. KRD291 TaxID=2792007 RepID=UPI001C4A2A42|nr:selenocysteine-specific translation elongation factor [Pseudonocardia sp. KRD291]MBW0102495.1 SelB C-terminal domain-containing protein [Pseudonocardia sp. KRD291]
MHVVCTAGHVDHGKSTLVRALTGMEPDRFAEERRRGMTIDLGFAWTTLAGGRTVAFVDVPGHERFVTTMLAGAGPVPAVLFVVAADEGWMPQSGEHADALEAIGVRHGLLVVTRSDLLEPELARDEAQGELAARGLGDWPCVCVSGATGEGLDTLRTALDALVTGLPVPDPGADVRLWVDRAFTIRGAGTVVTGTLPAGTVEVGRDLELDTADGRTPVGVRGLQALGETVPRAGGPARVAVNLRGVTLEQVGRGDVLLSPGAWPRAAEVDVRLHGVRGAGVEVSALPPELTLHTGSSAVRARVRPLTPAGDGHDDVVVRLRPDRSLPLRIGDRVVLRDPGSRRIVAGATVLDVAPPALRRRGAAARRAAELAGATGVPDADGELSRRGAVRAADLRAMGVPAAQVDALGARVPGAAGWLLDPDRAAGAAVALARAVAAHDEADPLDPGLSPAAARRAAGLPDVALVEAVLAAAADRGADGLVLDGGRVRAATPTGLPRPVREAMATLRADLQAAPFVAPDAGRLAELGLGPRALASLERAGELLRVTPDVVLLPDAQDRALELLAGLGDEFTLSQARQALDTTRRIAVPLLELLARRGHTERTPDGGHRLRPPR